MEETNDDCLTEEEAIEGNLKKITIPTNDQRFDPLTFLKDKEETIRSILKEERTKRKRMKFYLTLQVRFTKTRGDQVEIAEPHFHGRCHIVLKQEDIEHILRESIMMIVNSFVEYQREGSNWALDKVLGIKINIATYRPIKRSSYVPLPAKLAKKKAIINVQNTYQKCFMWSVLAALYPVVKDPQLVINHVHTWISSISTASRSLSRSETSLNSRRRTKCPSTSSVLRREKFTHSTYRKREMFAM